MSRQIAEKVAGGAHLNHAASLLGIQKQTLNKWLVAGRLHQEQDKQTPQSRLALWVDCAVASYAGWLIEQGNASAADRKLSSAWVKHRLGFLSEYRHQESAPTTQGAFEGTTPEQAIHALEGKLAAFLASEQLVADVLQEPTGDETPDDIDPAPESAGE